MAAPVKRRAAAPMVNIVGHPEVMDLLKEIAQDVDTGVAAKLSRTALRSGLAVLVREQKRNAPTVSISRKVGKGKRQRAAKLKTPKRAIGSRMVRRRRAGIYVAKAGLNVGKAHGRFPAAAAYAMGSGERRTKKGASRGKAPANKFISRTTEESRDVVEQFMFFRIKTRLPIEVERVAKKHRMKKQQAAGN
jgi:hypothetical protein